MTSALPKRLIEVDLPIKRISAHARREKSIRHGHISTLHMWWARRPLAACRAVVCAALWPDPADDSCPKAFRETARHEMQRWARENLNLLGAESYDRFVPFQTDPAKLHDNEQLRSALLDFIADFANWDNSTREEYLVTSRALTQSAHEALGGQTNSKPLVVDPFAGGGSIPLEALRIGADAFASDLNPIPVLLNKVLLEYVPKFRQRLADGVREWGERIGKQAEEELRRFYPKDDDGAVPIAYLWARTVRCEGPGCGAEIPLLRSLWLAKKGKRSTALKLVGSKQHKKVEVSVINNADPQDVGRGTSAGGKATCPVCGYTTPVESVRTQLSLRDGGSHDARLLAVVTNRAREAGQTFRVPTSGDIEAVQLAATEFSNLRHTLWNGLSAVPNEPLNHLRGFFNVVLYGIKTWGDILAPRQALTLSTFSRLVRDAPVEVDGTGYAEALKTCLALIVDRVAVRCTANCIWDATTGCIMQVFNQGQSLPARWEFAEMSPCIDAGSGWTTSLTYTLKVFDHLLSINNAGQAEQASATHHPLPDDVAQAVITDPPYYAAIPYADLSDFFYVWLRRTLNGFHGDLLDSALTEKPEEIVSLAHRAAMYREKDNKWFEQQMELACREARRICVQDGLGVFVFANKETAAWEAMLGGLINAGWVVTASWPIDTESGNRLRAKDSAALASSIHLVCRPRIEASSTGDWRDVLQELPRRMHEWMPRLAQEGVVGADAIFACLGPALEVFSQYSRVEKANGEEVTLQEFLEHVWAAVAKEALTVVFSDADATGFEEDARLTAIWLWTLFAGESNSPESAVDDVEQDEELQGTSTPKGFVLEYDAARKIAQGLGAHLESLNSLVQVKGEIARLLPVVERTRKLFGKDDAESPSMARKKKTAQLRLGFVAELEEAEETGNWGTKGAPEQGATVLDRVHQSMILFAAGRGEALRRFLVDEGVGRDGRFWRLSQVLSYLYPKTSDEKRWIDGVLARKKGLGF